MFTCEDLLKELNSSGSWNVEFFGSLAGEKLDEKSKAICTVARKIR